MKHQIKTTLLSLLTTIFMVGMLNAQTLPLDNFAIFPPGGVFNPNAKFVSMGESGGVQGPINGCDLYGFRAQTTPTDAVNLGMEILSATVSLPTLTFESTLPLFISQRNANGNGTGGNLTCGKILAYYFDNTTAGGQNNVVYTIFGSGFASGGIWVNSDQKLKKNVEPIASAIDIVNELEGVTYEYRVDEYPEMNLNRGRNYGFIVQDVKEVMPEAVTYGVDPDGKQSEFQGLNYDMIIPVLTEAVKEQQAVIESQEEVIKSLEDRLARLENLLSPTVPATDGAVNTFDSGATLNQNRPNPFEGVTTIEYSVPENTNAELVIYDLNGTAMKAYNVVGVGSVEFDASTLSSGIYVYALIANGQTLARQKMVVQ